MGAGISVPAWLQSREVRRLIHTLHAERAAWQAKLDAERAERVAQLERRFVHRLTHQGLAYGFSSWLDWWLQRRRQRQLIAASIGRMRTPKLSAAMSHWYQEWQASLDDAATQAVQATVCLLYTSPSPRDS